MLGIVPWVSTGIPFETGDPLALQTGEHVSGSKGSALPADVTGYLNRYWRYIRALSSTSASVTWVRPREATRSSMRLRIKRRMRKGLRLMRRSASGSQVICVFSTKV